MVQVAATAAKMVTVAPAGVEGLSAAVNVATTVTKGAEILQPAAVAAEATQGVAKATEVGAKTIEAAAPEAIQAAETLDSVVDAGGAAAKEAAMKNMVDSGVVEALKASQTAEETALNAKAARIRYLEIQKAVQPQIIEWERSHLPGDDIQGWVDSRAAAERQFTVTEGVNRDLKEWQMKNPQGKDESPEKYAGRLEQRMIESQQGQEKLYDQMLAEQEEKRQGMSKQEFMRLYAELLQKRAIADNLAIRLQKLRMSPHQTQMRKDVLTRAEAQLEDMRADIATRETELQFDAVGSPWKQWIIPAMVGVSMAAGPATEAANTT